MNFQKPGWTSFQIPHGVDLVFREITVKSSQPDVLRLYDIVPISTTKKSQLVHNDFNFNLKPQIENCIANRDNNIGDS